MKKVEAWMAEDGKVFETKKGCLEYERGVALHSTILKWVDWNLDYADTPAEVAEHLFNGWDGLMESTGYTRKAAEEDDLDAWAERIDAGDMELPGAWEFHTLAALGRCVYPKRSGGPGGHHGWFFGNQDTNGLWEVGCTGCPGAPDKERVATEEMLEALQRIEP